MSCHPGFVVPFIEHRQSKLNIIFKDPRIFEMVNGRSMGFYLESPVALASNKRVNLSFEALKPGIDFSSVSMKVLNVIFF